MAAPLGRREGWQRVGWEGLKCTKRQTLSDIDLLALKAAGYRTKTVKYNRRLHGNRPSEGCI